MKKSSFLGGGSCPGTDKAHPEEGRMLRFDDNHRRGECRLTGGGPGPLSQAGVLLRCPVDKDLAINCRELSHAGVVCFGVGVLPDTPVVYERTRYLPIAASVCVCAHR